MKNTYSIDVEHKETLRYNIEAATLEEAKKEAERLYNRRSFQTPGEITIICRHFQPNFKKV